MKTSPRKIPFWLTLGYTAFMGGLIPIYWYWYGPTNFLYFCDVCLILTLVAVWREDALLVSMCAVGIVLPQTFWVIDFLATVAGHPLTGMTAYMFNPKTALYLRGLSLFHGWIPFLLIFLVWKLGYDKRALKFWTGLAWLLILFCFFVMPGPNPNAGLKPVNINYVWGMNDAAAQTWMPTYAWLAVMLLGMPVLIFIPTHLVLKKLMPPRR